MALLRSLHVKLQRIAPSMGSVADSVGRWRLAQSRRRGRPIGMRMPAIDWYLGNWRPPGLGARCAPAALQLALLFLLPSATLPASARP